MKDLRRSQKEKEKVIFDHFARLTVLPFTRLHQPAPPAADILFESEGQHIALEICELYPDNSEQTGSALRQQQALRDKILELAVREVEKEIAFPFDLYVTFRNNEVNNHEVIPLARYLAESIKALLMGVTPSQNVQILNRQIEDWKINLHSYTIHVDSAQKYHLYSAIAAGWIPTLSVDHIKTTLAKKEPNLNDYHSNSDQVWLLVVELGGLASSFTDIQTAIQHQYLTKFDRLFLLRSLHSKVHELKIAG